MQERLPEEDQLIYGYVNAFRSDTPSENFAFTGQIQGLFHNLIADIAFAELLAEFINEQLTAELPEESPELVSLQLNTVGLLIVTGGTFWNKFDPSNRGCLERYQNIYGEQMQAFLGNQRLL